MFAGSKGWHWVTRSSRTSRTESKWDMLYTLSLPCKTSKQIKEGKTKWHVLLFFYIHMVKLIEVKICTQACCLPLSTHGLLVCVLVYLHAGSKGWARDCHHSRWIHAVRRSWSTGTQRSQGYIWFHCSFVVVVVFTFEVKIFDLLFFLCMHSLWIFSVCILQRIWVSVLTLYCKIQFWKHFQ